jgi:putative endonuclease
MAVVYLLQSKSGRYYYGSTTDLARRVEQHERGHTATTARDRPWRLVASREFGSLQEARRQERIFKRWKNPARVLAWLGRWSSPDIGCRGWSPVQSRPLAPLPFPTDTLDNMFDTLAQRALMMCAW